MEENDELVPLPNEEGILVLANSSWREVPDLTVAAETLQVLDLSFNLVEVLPGATIGSFSLLRELDVSANRLNALPLELEQCKQLRRLKANGNYLRSVPPGLGTCMLLEEVVLSENKLTELPDSFGNLIVLRVLLLQNNDLRSLPCGLGGLNKLVELNCEGNPQLATIPEPLRSDTELIMWLCNLNAKHAKELQLIEELNACMEAHAVQVEESKLRLREDVERLQEEKRRLINERPKRYLALQRGLRRATASCVVS
ncbi:unnamed protein product [Phaeothamnion confervicola]